MVDVKNITTATENKKFDAKQAKYIFFENMGYHNFKFDTPPGIHNVFYVDRLRATSMDLYFSQIMFPVESCKKKKWQCVRFVTGFYMFFVSSQFFHFMKYRRPFCCKIFAISYSFFCFFVFFFFAW